MSNSLKSFNWNKKLFCVGSVKFILTLSKHLRFRLIKNNNWEVGKIKIRNKNWTLVTRFPRNAHFHFHYMALKVDNWIHSVLCVRSWETPVQKSEYNLGLLISNLSLSGLENLAMSIYPFDPWLYCNHLKIRHSGLAQI